jgi:hypothetical protein
MNNVQVTTSIPIHLQEEDILGGTEQIYEPKPKRQKLEFREKCLTWKGIHKEITPTNFCVDKARGLFLVDRGVTHPVDMQKCIWSLSWSSHLYADDAKRSGMKRRHIRELSIKTTYKEGLELHKSHLNDISQEGTFRHRIKQTHSFIGQVSRKQPSKINRTVGELSV